MKAASLSMIHVPGVQLCFTPGSVAESLLEVVLSVTRRDLYYLRWTERTATPRTDGRIAALSNSLQLVCTNPCYPSARAGQTGIVSSKSLLGKARILGHPTPGF